MTTHYISIYLDSVKPENIPQLLYPITSSDTVLTYLPYSDKFSTFAEPSYMKGVEVFYETEEEFFDTVAKYQLIRLITS